MLILISTINRIQSPGRHQTIQEEQSHEQIHYNFLFAKIPSCYPLGDIFSNIIKLQLIYMYQRIKKRRDDVHSARIISNLISDALVLMFPLFLENQKSF